MIIIVIIKHVIRQSTFFNVMYILYFLVFIVNIWFLENMPQNVRYLA